MLTHPHFVAAARSAEQWLPHVVVPPSALAGFLQEQRARGYTICAVEQTAHSVSLEKFEFPPRVVLVLGAEGTGCPAHVLALADVCIEIPQHGLVRSLNVASTGSIVMFEFARQRQGRGRQRCGGGARGAPQPLRPRCAGGLPAARGGAVP
jgi:tRNA guanosine-2'-O-methyltransferase